ncbi:MAG TPA: DNA-binding transcriptional regulator [Gemmatimonadales bacterium]|nr:DNA-binding transcriptional regulator [Gemmatimonadales bacterium]
MARRKYKSDAFAAIRESAAALRRIGAIDATTMRTFDETCLATPGMMSPAEIRQLRRREKVSQPVFARYLNSSESTVQKWESGAKRPSGPALRLLAVVQKHGLRVLT